MTRKSVRPLVALVVLGLLATAVGSAAAARTPASRSKPAFVPLRVHGEPVRSMVINDVKQLSVLSVPDFARLKADGFNTVTIYPYRFVSDRFDNTQAAGPLTEPDAVLTQVIARAHAEGLAVQLIPTIWVGDGATGKFQWRGNIAPTDIGAFFDSFREMTNHYAKLATKTGVEIFGVSSEMVSVEKWSDQWRQTIGEVRQHYKGPLTYFTIPRVVTKITWWDAVDYPGTSPYLAMSAKPVPGYDEILGAWYKVHLPDMRKLSAYVGKPLQAAEIGYAAAAGAATHPETTPGGAPQEKLQADLYKALLTAVGNDRAFDGISFYRWSAYEVGPLNAGFSPKGKLAECEIAKVWAPAGAGAVQCATAGRVLS